MRARADRGNHPPVPPQDAGSEAKATQPWAQPFVALLLAAFVVCGLFGIEAWPFSGFRLFSAPRPPAWSSYHGVVVGLDGRTSRLRVSSLPAAYRGFGLAAARLTSQPRPKQLAVCRAYADAVGSAGLPVGELRIYRVAHVVLPREGGRPTTPVTRTLVARCAPSDDP